MTIAVLTGDIINSRRAEPEVWLDDLKQIFNRFGKQSKDWEIYRGDSFQISLPPQMALEVAFLIKAAIKKHKPLDVRISIGLGNIDYKSEKISESNGSAFVNSGEQFEKLKKNTLAIKSDHSGFDRKFNIMLNLIMFFADKWSPATAQVIQTSLENKDLKQSEIARKLNKKSQSQISEILKRGGYEHLVEVLNYYQSELKSI